MSESLQQVELTFEDNEALLDGTRACRHRQLAGAALLRQGEAESAGESDREPNQGGPLPLDAMVQAGVVEGAPLRLQVTPSVALRERIYVVAMSRRADE